MNAKEILQKSDKVVLIACLLGIVLFCTLSFWQTKRLLWKEGLITRLEQKLVQQPISLDAFATQYPAHSEEDILSQRYSEQGGEFTPITLRGEFLPHSFFLLNRSMASKAGVNWLQIFASDDGQNVLLNRGFIPFELKDSAKPDVLSQGTQEITAMVRLARGQPAFMPDNVPAENIWFYIDLMQMENISGVDLVDYYGMVQASPVGYDFPVAYNWQFDIPNNHLQYSITWFAFALITLIMGVYYQYRYINKMDD